MVKKSLNDLRLKTTRCSYRFFFCAETRTEKRNSDKTLEQDGIFDHDRLVTFGIDERPEFGDSPQIYVLMAHTIKYDLTHDADIDKKILHCDSLTLRLHCYLIALPHNATC